jgi:DNA-binding MarR family transcriptional regulator
MSDELRLRAARSVLGVLPLAMRTVGAGLREEGVELTPHQLRLLVVMSMHPRTLREVAAIQGVTPATATSIVTTMENRGWVRREHDSKDRRRVVVTVTDQGRAALKTAQAAAERAMAVLLAPLSEDELGAVVSGIDVLWRLPESTWCCPANGALVEGDSE